MNPRAALVIVPLAALLLASCSTNGGGQRGNPAVTSMDTTEARDLAASYCRDIAALGQKQATSKMATRLAGTTVSKHDQDAILEFAYYKLCPGNF